MSKKHTLLLEPRDAWRIDALGVGSLLVVVGMLLPLGGLHPGPRWVGHVGVAMLLLCAGSLSLEALSKAGTVTRLGRAGAWLIAAVVPAFLPVPFEGLAIVSPNLAALRSPGSWSTFSVDQVASVGAFCAGFLVLGFALSVGVWAALRWRSRPFLRASTLLLWGISLLAWVHVASGATAAMGMFPVQDLPDPFLGPLVSANHLATALLFLIPLTWHTGQREESPGWRALATGGVVVGCALLLMTGSVGAWFSLAGVAVVFSSPTSAWPRALRALMVVGVAFVAVILVQYVQPTWAAHSVTGRLDQYLDTWAMVWAYPATGVGIGAYESVFPAFDSSGRFLHHTHAHNEFLQGLAETGLWGLFCGVQAVRSVVVGSPHKKNTHSILSAALLGVALHACLDFPFRVPFLALLCAAGVALWVCGMPLRAPTSGLRMRWLLWGVALLQLPMAAWQGRAMVEAHALGQMATDREEAVEVLGRVAPWRPELGLDEVALRTRQGDREGALRVAVEVANRHRSDADVLRQVGWAHALLGDPEGAMTWLREAEARAPSDFRAALGQARVARAQGDGQAATQAYGRALHLGPVNAELVEEVYAFLPVGGHWLEVLEQGEPHNSVLLATVVQGDDPVLAMEAFEQAVRLRPAYYADAPARAGMWFRAGRVEEAEAFLRARTEDDETGRVWLELGVVLEQTGTPEEVYAAYHASSRLGWEGANSRWVRAKRRFEGASSAAILARQKVLSGARAPGLILVWAELQEETGDAEGCLETLRRYLPQGAAGEQFHAERLLSRCAEAAL